MINFCFKLNICGLILFLSFLSVLGQEGKSLIRIEKNGKYGYVNLKGKVIAEPKFDNADEEFSDGLARITLNKKFGIINLKGDIIMLPDNVKYYNPFSEGLAAVKVDTGWGFINKKGVFVIKPIFYEVRDFSEGLAVVAQIQEKDVIEQYTVTNERITSGSGKKIQYVEYGYIDKVGNLVIPFQFYEARNFKYGFAEVFEPMFNTRAYIDKQGNIIARPSNQSYDPNKERPKIALTGNEVSFPLTHELSYDSNPEGAEVFLIPQYDYEHPELWNNDDKLLKYKVPTGNAPNKVNVREYVYWVLFIKNGIRKWATVDIPTNTIAKVEF